MNFEQVSEEHGISSVLRIISEWLLSLRGQTLHRENPSTTTFLVVMEPKYVAGHEVSAGMLGLGAIGPNHFLIIWRVPYLTTTTTTFLECIAAPGGNTCILRNHFMNFEQVSEEHGISSVLRIISEWLLSLRGQTLHRENPSTTTFLVVMEPKYVAGHEVSAGMLGLGAMGQCKQRHPSSSCHMSVEGTEQWFNSDAPPLHTFMI